MHGRKRLEYKALHRDPKVVAKLSAKATAWHQLQAALLLGLSSKSSPSSTSDAAASCGHANSSSSSSSSTTSPPPPKEQQSQQPDESARDATIEPLHDTAAAASAAPPVSSTPSSTTTTTTLDLIAKAVTVNPDPIWLWNFRRQCALSSSSSSSQPIPTTASSSLSSSCYTAEEEHDPAYSASAAASIGWFDREQALTEAALTANPKAYAAWHHRKVCLQRHIVALATTTTTATNTSALQEKLEDAAHNSSSRMAAILQHELELTAVLFHRDERNFHCWSYRRFVVSCCLWWHATPTTPIPATTPSSTNDSGTWTSLPNGEWILPTTNVATQDRAIRMGAQLGRSRTLQWNGTIEHSYGAKSVTQSCLERTTAAAAARAVVQTEWDFCGRKIRDNFSNCSAVHYRSKLLPLLFVVVPTTDSTTNSISMESIIASEFDLVANAIFTEPDDQTAWWYQRFLLDFMKEQLSQSSSSTSLNSPESWYFVNVLEPHITQLRELQQEMENRSKWVLLGLVQCLEYSTNDNIIDNNNSNDERCTLFHTLMDIDPDRKERYRYLLDHTRQQKDGGTE